MRTIYIGSRQKNKKSNGSNFKIYFFLFLFVAIIGSGLKVSAPILVERWINQQGEKSSGYAFSVREVELAFTKGELLLKDVKVFNPKTEAKIIEAPELTINIDWQNLVLSQNQKYSVVADKVDVFLSKDFSSEVERIQAMSGNSKNDFYLELVEGKFGKLNVIEQKEDLARTVIELSDVNLKLKEVSLLTINKKSEFSISSNVADGGKLNLSGKTTEENGRTPWSINGSLKEVPSNIFNKIEGDKLPFSFNESRLNAEISAVSDNGVVSGEIFPDVKRLNLISEKPGIPTQTIARALTDELTFTLPFTLKDNLTLHYSSTLTKLKNYRKDPVTIVSIEPTKESVPKTEKAKKSFSFWTF
ncbi:MAG: hypothetical protein NDI69_05500 [Bacteriovoracaceae bacterium]|nr:hypothetical protein [Bacteriovoracaceae bacterium]